jgi:hypothetical protein
MVNWLRPPSNKTLVMPQKLRLSSTQPEMMVSEETGRITGGRILKFGSLPNRRLRFSSMITCQQYMNIPWQICLRKMRYILMDCWIRQNFIVLFCDHDYISNCFCAENILGAFALSQKVPLKLHRVRLLPSYISSAALMGRTFLKCDIGNFYDNKRKNAKFGENRAKSIGQLQVSVKPCLSCRS